MNIKLSAPYAPLVRRIEAEATVIGDQVLKIDHFLNHRIEPRFITEMGGELARRLAQFEPSVVLTAEASGIAPGLVVAQALDIPLVYAKKYAPQVESPAIARVIPSPTKGGETKLVLSQRYIVPSDRVVIVDDFLSNGRTAVALKLVGGDRKGKAAQRGRADARDRCRQVGDFLLVGIEQQAVGHAQHFCTEQGLSADDGRELIER